MSIALKKISRLKKISSGIINKLDLIDPIVDIPQDYVSASGLTRSDLLDKIDILRNCSTVIEMREVENKLHEKSMAIAAANFCKQHVVCPICADRMQTRRRARYNDAIKKQAEMVMEGKRFAYMITYTIADGEYLSDRINALRSARRKFRLMGQKRSKKYSGGESSAIRAGISTMEIKRGARSGLWHAHIHEMVFCDRRLTYNVYDSSKKRKLEQLYRNRIPDDKLLDCAINTGVFQGKTIALSKLSSEWLSATNGESINIRVDPIIHVPKKCSGKKRRMYQKMSFIDSVAYQAREILKYCSKINPDKASDILVMLNDTYNRRLVDCVGDFRGIPGDDYVEPPENEIENFVMIWKNGKYNGAIPGGIRTIDRENEANTARKKCGELLGRYRRQRKSIMASINVIGSDAARMLDDAKRAFRSQYNAIWSVYRSQRSVVDRSKNYGSGCSQTLALAGIYSPGSDYRDLYSIAFS